MPTVAALIRATRATGPVASWREEPNRPAITGGRKAAYRPNTAGKPANLA